MGARVGAGWVGGVGWVGLVGVLVPKAACLVAQQCNAGLGASELAEEVRWQRAIKDVRIRLARGHPDGHAAAQRARRANIDGRRECARQRHFHPLHVGVVPQPEPVREFLDSRRIRNRIRKHAARSA